MGRQTNLNASGANGRGILTAHAQGTRGSRLLVSLKSPSGEWTVGFDGKNLDQRLDDDFLVPLTLMPAMAQRFDLALPCVRSAQLWSNIPHLQRTFRSWFPDLRRAKVTTAIKTPSSRPRSNGFRSSRTIALFSGGVDSYHTVLAERDRIGALLFVSGFDLDLGRSEEPDHAGVVSTLRSAAARLGLPLLHVKTNLRRFSDRWLLWGDQYVGAGLASVALLMAGMYDEVIIPSTHVAQDDFPYGTHLRTDPLWSTEQMQIRVYGAHIPRPAKVAAISRSEIALDTLRVCWENRGGAYNCGVCEKCHRTMVELYLAGSLERCITLPDGIDVDALAAMPLLDASRRSFAMSLLRAAERSDMPLAPAICGALISALGGS